MAKDCPVYTLAGAISRSIDRKGSEFTDYAYAAEYHNNGICSEAQCAWWVGDTPETSACVFVKSVQKQSNIIKVLDYINQRMADIVRAIANLR